jgi:hypothetical protein
MNERDRARMRWMAGACVLASCAAFAPAAHADDGRTRFAQGTWATSAYGGWIGDESHTILSFHGGLSYHLFDDFAVTGEAGAYEIWRENARGSAGSVDLLLRWYALRHDFIAFFVEAGCGVILSTIDLPPQTSSWNFTPQARVGVTFEVAPRTHVLLLGGWWHASTAGIEQPNPGFNGAQFAMGMLFEH